MEGGGELVGHLHRETFSPKQPPPPHHTTTTTSKTSTAAPGIDNKKSARFVRGSVASYTPLHLPTQPSARNLKASLLVMSHLLWAPSCVSQPPGVRGGVWKRERGESLSSETAQGEALKKGGAHFMASRELRPRTE